MYVHKVCLELFLFLKNWSCLLCSIRSIKSILILHADLLHDSIFNFFFPGLASIPQNFLQYAAVLHTGKCYGWSFMKDYLKFKKYILKLQSLSNLGDLLLLKTGSNLCKKQILNVLKYINSVWINKSKFSAFRTTLKSQKLHSVGSNFYGSG